MKKLFFTSLIVCASAIEGFAQPTLSAATNNPVVGDLFIGHHADTAGPTMGIPGAGVTWNFTALIETSRDTTSYVSCPATPYCDSFSGSTVVMKNGDTYQYCVTSPGKFTILGAFADGALLKFDNTKDVLRFPMTYGTIQIDTVVTAMPPSGGAGIVMKHIDSTTADGYGTLKLPSGTYPNVLRLHIVTHNVVTIEFPDTVLTMESREEGYEWYMPGFHSPLLTMSYDSTGGNHLTDIIYYTKPAPAATAIAEVETVKKLNVYPNPASDAVNIQFDVESPGPTAITLKDLAGRTVASTEQYMSSGNYVLDYKLPAVPDGLYVLSVQYSGGMLTNRLIIKK